MSYTGKGPPLTTMATKTTKVQPADLKGITACFSDSSLEIRSLAKAIAEKEGTNASKAVLAALREKASGLNLVYITG